MRLNLEHEQEKNHDDCRRTMRPGDFLSPALVGKYSVHTETGRTPRGEDEEFGPQDKTGAE